MDREVPHDGPEPLEREWTTPRRHHSSLPAPWRSLAPYPRPFPPQERGEREIASWLNQVEGFFAILSKQSLGAIDFRSKCALRDHLAAYMRAWNKSPTPFAWTKAADAIIKSHRRMLRRISTAVH